MNTTEKIITYLTDRGLDLSYCIDTVRHQIHGTVVIASIRMWGVGCGPHYPDWQKLIEILSEKNCPIRMDPIESAPHERPHAFNRLVWIGNEVNL